MRFILKEKGVWGIVNGTLKNPKLLDDGKNKAEVAEYERKSSMALYIIYMNVSNECKNITDDIDGPVEAWKLLATYYQTYTLFITYTRF